MALTKLSLVAALALSTVAFAGGDIAPSIVLEPVAAPLGDMTTVNGKLTGYYITADDAEPTHNMFSKDWSQLGFAATLDVAHKFTENITANFGAVGFLNANRDIPFGYIGQYFEGEKSGAFFNVANITAEYSDTTAILGRQLLDTPMLGGFDWLLAPGSFEAYTVANSSIENVTLVGSYIRSFREFNTGGNFSGLDGNNWTVGAAYDDKALSTSVWYYTIDSADYTQVYADAGYDFGIAKLEALFVNTNYDVATDSNAYGARASTEFAGVSLMGAYVNVADNVTGFVGGMDNLYTSSWNSLTTQSLGHNFKVEAGTEFAGISATASYAYYEYSQHATASEDNDGAEIDVILGYGITEAVDLNVVYTNTDYGIGDDTNALEVYANYNF